MQEVVYYIDIENPEKVVDTGIVCRTLDAVTRGYSGDFYVDQKGEYIYYSGGTNEYKRKNIQTGEEELIATYTDNEGYFSYAYEFNGKQLVYVRSHFDNEIGIGAKIFEIDVDTKEMKEVWRDECFEELLAEFLVFKGNDEYYLQANYPSSDSEMYGQVGNHYYLVYKDGTRKLIFDDNEIWNAATLNRKG